MFHHLHLNQDSLCKARIHFTICASWVLFNYFFFFILIAIFFPPPFFGQVNINEKAKNITNKNKQNKTQWWQQQQQQQQNRLIRLRFNSPFSSKSSNWIRETIIVLGLSFLCILGVQTEWFLFYSSHSKTVWLIWLKPWLWLMHTDNHHINHNK